jgi:hypothetical protein
MGRKKERHGNGRPLLPQLTEWRECTFFTIKA